MSFNDSQTQPNKVDILIVDDTPEDIRFLSTILLEQGYQVRKALNGKMALTAAQTTPPDLILLDITMPEMNGYEVCRQLKENSLTESIPVIFLSALDDVADKLKAFQVGGVDFIAKPFQFEEVLIRIQTQLKIQALQSHLQLKNTQLGTALDELKQMQTQLIKKEKMLGLGQLVAGVCHEINNPISFIAGNINPAHEYIQTLLKLINAYQQELPEPGSAVREVLESSDLDFITSDLQSIMKSMQVGVDRIRTIILALRIFSRLGESDIKTIDIHAGIESTLFLLHHRLSETVGMPDIKIIREYSKLPLITCYVSELNQVFLNLFNNAIDTLKQEFGHSTHPDKAPTIWIRTELTQEQAIAIRIKDNGSGLSEEAKKHLFEPFFTTKPVGQGTGLGLATSYQIVVDKHKGNLSYTSTEGNGTEFIVEVPLNLA